MKKWWKRQDPAERVKEALAGARLVYPPKAVRTPSRRPGVTMSGLAEAEKSRAEALNKVWTFEQLARDRDRLDDDGIPLA